MIGNSKASDNKEKCGICFPSDSETACIEDALLCKMRNAKRHGLIREQIGD